MHIHHCSVPVLRSTLLLVPLVLFAACGSDSGTPDESLDAAVAPSDASAPGSDLDGTWLGPCYMDARTTLVYAGLALTGTYTEYEAGSGCEAGRERHIARWTGRATVGAEASPGVRRLDLAFDGFRSTALTAAEAELVNTNAYCGFTDWAPGVEKDILGRDCFGFSIPVGGRSLDVYRVEGDTLLFGANARISTSPSESERPTELDPTRPFMRVRDAS